MSFCLKKAIVIVIAIALVACTTDVYESGDGDYSYIRGDFANLSTDSHGRIVSFLTDDNATIKLPSPVAVEGMKADTTYRALVYYNQPQNAAPELLNLKMVSVAKAFEESDDDPLKTDPVGWESMWVSSNGTYLNLALNLLDGVSDDKDDPLHHVLGVCLNSTANHHFYFTLYHDQSGIPEYYTRKAYFSMPLDDTFQKNDTLTLTVNTYDGIQTKTVILP